MSSYVIGDIHGCVDELRYLVDDLPVHANDEIIFLGDYIDRGPDSSGVVGFLIALKEQWRENKLVFLKGNHEDMLLSYLQLNGQHGTMFMLNGGKTTVQSYGLSPEQATPIRLNNAMPPDHLAFYQALEATTSASPTYASTPAFIH